MAVYTQVSPTEAGELVASLGLGQLLSLQGCQGGIENTNYFVSTDRGEHVLTLFERLNFAQLPFYLALMKHLAQAGIPVPDPATDQAGVYLHRLKGYVGNYYAQLGTVDVIVFTAGVGENSPIVRAGALAGLEGLGIEIDPVRNEARSRKPRVISTDNSRVTVLVIPTNEELEIARQTLATISRTHPSAL